MYDYQQRKITPEFEKNYDKIFSRGIMDVGKPLVVECHYSQGGKYICICKSKICKKGIKK